MADLTSKLLNVLFLKLDSATIRESSNLFLLVFLLQFIRGDSKDAGGYFQVHIFAWHGCIQSPA